MGVVKEAMIWDENVIPFQYEKIRELEKQYGSSFYIWDMIRLKSNYDQMKQAFSSRYEKFIIGYSYKTNYLPLLCKKMNQWGAYAEVVSRLEYELALAVGVKPEKIIFNGPLKDETDLIDALENGSLVHIDSMYEAEHAASWMKRNPAKNYSVGLRVNFSGVEGGTVSRFGMSVENGTFQQALRLLQTAPNVSVTGLHAHLSTGKRNVSTYGHITKNLCLLAKEFVGEDLKYIDVGGGMYGELPASFQMEAPSFADYAEEICGIMNDEFAGREEKPFLIIEPGISLVARPFTFVAKVMEVKEINGEFFVLVDGSVHNVKPTMHNKNLPVKIIRKGAEKRKGQEEIYHIVGYTCMERDYLVKKIKGMLPEKGDYIAIGNVGAYTIVFNPPFIRERPAILAFDGNKIRLARKRETFREFFNENLYVF